MLKSKITWQKLVTIAPGLAVITTLAVLVPWAKVVELLVQLTAFDLIILSLMAGFYYGAKATRFWLMLKGLNYSRPLGLITLIYLSAQPATFMPGGEFYRTILLKEHADIPIHRSSSAIVLQGLVEVAGLISIGLVSALVAGQNVGPVVVVLVMFAVIVVSLANGWVPTSSKIINRLPLVKISDTKLRRFITDNQLLLRPTIFGRLFAVSLVPIAAGVVIIYVSANAVGVNFNWLQAVIAYSLPAIIAYVAFIPGMGEGGSIGILTLLGAALSPAIAITLLLRLFTVGAGILFGPLAMLTRRYTKMGIL